MAALRDAFLAAQCGLCSAAKIAAYRALDLQNLCATIAMN
jgi:hypothetical protein